jgi:hypothetical protein
MKIPAPAAILSFAVELLMKSLLLLRKGKYPKKHNLLTLYTILEVADREKIELNFANSSFENYRYPASRFIVEGHTPPEGETSFSTPADEIYYRLQEHDDSFVHWRYIASFSIDTPDKVRQYDFSFICRFYDAFLKHTKEIIWD